MIRLACINIEGDIHRDRVAAFLRDFNAEVVCVQELNEASVSFFERSLGMKGYFMPMLRYHSKVSDTTSPLTTFGVGIFSALPVSNVRYDHYYGSSSGEAPLFVLGDETTTRRVLIRVTVKQGDESYTVATTHFTRTSDGSASDKQRIDMKNLLGLLSENPEMILCGDFNAPRGGEIFAMLAEKYKDNIPPEYTSSLDSTLHQLRDSKQLMVDGLFSTLQYALTDVRLSESVSDHKAVTACIAKA